jgi:hypothetical protein
MTGVREVTELITPGPAVALAAPDGDAVRVSCRDASDRVTATGVVS